MSQKDLIVCKKCGYIGILGHYYCLDKPSFRNKRNCFGYHPLGDMQIEIGVL